MDDFSEDAYISTSLRGSRINVWVGLNDRRVENTWVWQSGLNSTYVNWGTGEPDGGVGENCVAMNAGTSWLWSDTGCDEYHKVVCEKMAYI